jgi:hypothetical protein
MKKQFIVGILFLSGLWGVSEVVLGDLLYKAQLDRIVAPILLSVIAFAILTIARARVSLPGSAILIGILVMLYKTLGMGLFSGPFYACHLLGIFSLAVGYELTCLLTRGRYKPLIGALGSYLGFALFAILITYVFQYRYWSGGKVLHYIFVPGSITAGINLFVVPLVDRGMRKLASIETTPQTNKMPRWELGAVSAAALGLWIFSIVLGLAY